MHPGDGHGHFGQRHTVAGVLDRADQLLCGGRSLIVVDGCLFRGKINVGHGHPVGVTQGPLDVPRARGAMHAGHRQYDFLHIAADLFLMIKFSTI